VANNIRIGSVSGRHRFSSVCFGATSSHSHPLSLTKLFSLINTPLQRGDLGARTSELFQQFRNIRLRRPTRGSPTPC
jgi:hypothetical protein